jgi:hypothetical protein
VFESYCNEEKTLTEVSLPLYVDLALSRYGIISIAYLRRSSFKYKLEVG